MRCRHFHGPDKRIRLRVTAVVFGLFLAQGAALCGAEALLDVRQTIQLPYVPVDMQVSAQGNWVYLLNDQGVLLIYSADGKLKGTVTVGPEIDQIKSGPREDIVFLLSRKKGTLQVAAITIRESIDIEGAPVKGDIAAPVTIAVFSDFQCSYCARLGQILDQVLAQHPKQVKVVFKHFPLRGHTFAVEAAQAAVAAQSLGKFWEFHDLLFEHYASLGQDKLKEIAAALDLEWTALEKRMQAPAVMARIEADKQNGENAGVRGTPAVFVDGLMLRDKSLRGFEQAIEAALQNLSTGGKP